MTGAIETPNFLKDTAGTPTINDPKKVYCESTRSLSTRIDSLGHGTKNGGVSYNFPFVQMPKLLLHDANTSADGISKMS